MGVVNEAVEDSVGVCGVADKGVPFVHGDLGSLGSGAARLAAIPAGVSLANTRSPVHVVVISSGSEGDQTAESLEVKAL
jgi:hypothetical protein